jgi:N6-L-threonylcarbamoyladenine synthase
MLNHGLDFSFSGLKTAVLYGIKKILPEGETEGKTLDPSTLALICREAEDAITDVLVHKTGTALTQAEQKSTPYKGLIVAGGVSANTHIRQALTALAAEHTLPIYFPTAHTAGDNALMIATALALRPANHQPLIPPTLTAYSDRPLEQA